MIKKIISGLLIVTMMITSVDLTVFAEEDIQTDCIVAEEDTAVLGDETGDEINDETYDEVELLGAVKPNQDERFPATIQPVSDRKDFKEFKAIHNRKELEAIVNNTSGKYYLANDIDLAGKDWTPIGYTKDNKGENLTDFRGILDGQGHSIKNMTMNPSERYAKYYPNGVGLFASIGDNYGYSPGKSIGTYAVQNLILEDVSINASGDLSGVSAVAGRLNSLDENSSVLFDNIVVTGSVSGPGYVGAIIGNAGSDKCTISNCSNYASVTSANGFAGGIVCYTDGPIENCVNHGTVNGHGGIAAGTQSDISGCKNYGDISVSYQSDNTYVPDYDMHYSFGGIVGAMNYYSDDHSYRSITDCHNYGNIHVSDSNQSAVVGGVAGKTSGIVFENCSNDGSVLWEYTGQYDITSTGLFSGGIVGEAENNGFEHDLLNNCNNNGSVFGRVSGGVAGRALGFVKGCTNSGTVTNGGGIIGECEAYNDRYTIESCENYGRIEGNFGSGIVFAGNQTSVTKCKNYGEIDITIIEDSSSAGLTGGIAGSCGDISECLNFGEITVQNKNMNSYYVSVGGIAGDVSGEALNCINYGSIYSNCNTGGIAGSSNHTRKCRNEGSLSVICDDSKGADCGGIVAAASLVDECSNYGDISMQVHNFHVWSYGYGTHILSPPEPMVGGIAAKKGSISNCYNCGDLYITNSSLGNEQYDDRYGGIENHMFGAIAGGISGHSRSVINSYNVGKVYAEASSGYYFAGGVIGYGGTTRAIENVIYTYENAEWEEAEVNGTISLSNSIEAEVAKPAVSQQKRQKGTNAIGNFLSPTKVDNNMYRQDGIKQESWTDNSKNETVWFGSPVEPMSFYDQSPYTKLGWDFDSVWTWPTQGGLPVLKWEGLTYGPFMEEVTEGGNSSYVARGTTGDITWSVYRKVSLDGDYYSLKLEGKGEMPDYAQGEQPWKNYNDRIISISIDKKITSIGAYAFAGLTKGDIEMRLGTGLTKIGTGAFEGSVGIKALLLPKSLVYIAEEENGNDTAFTGCDNLTLQVWHDSYALEYAKRHNLKYAEINETTIEVSNNVEDRTIYYYVDNYSDASKSHSTEFGAKYSSTGGCMGLGGFYEKVKWGGDLFALNPKKFSKNIALLSGALSAAAEGREDQVRYGSMGTIFDKAAGNDGEYILQAYKDLGFKDDDIYLFSYPGSAKNLGSIDSAFDDDQKAFSIAYMPIKTDGKDYYLLIVTVRGTKTTQEAYADKTTGNRWNADFGENVYEYVEDFYNEIKTGFEYVINQHPEIKTDKKKVKILINGHSLGGAAANLFGAYINKSDYALKSNIFIYTFGGLNSYKPSSESAQTIQTGYENIHNIYNQWDSYGPNDRGDKLTDGIGSVNGRFGHLDQFTKRFVEEDLGAFGVWAEVGLGSAWNHIMPGYLYGIRNDLVKCGKHAGVSCVSACPVDIEVYESGKIVGRIVNNVVDDNVTVIPMYVIGEYKYYFLPEDGEYEVKMIGTSDGIMDCMLEDIGGDAPFTKIYENIKVSKDKIVKTDITGNMEIEESKLLILDTTGTPVKEVLEDGDEVKYFPYDDVLESDIPADGVIPDGIWLGGVKDLVYTGKKLTQDFRVYDGTTLLTVNKDYKVAYKNNQKQYTIADPGNLAANDKKKAPQISITMKGNYSGKETVYFSINSTGTNPEAVKTEPYSIAGDKVTITDTSGNTALSAAYDKSGAKPSLRILYEDTILKEGRDYSLKYAGNTKYPATKASVTITGMGKFNGKKTVPFAITQRSFSTAAGITVVASDKAEGKKAGQYLTTVKVFDSEGKLLKAGTDYEKNIVYMKDGAELTKTDFPKAGDVITVRVTGKGGYTNSYIETKYNIVPTGQVNDISKATFKIITQQYNKGRAVTITSQDMFDQAFIGKGKTPLTLSTDGGVTGDFMVVPGSYVKNTGKGTAKVTFMGINGNTGTKTVSFGIGTRSLKDFWKGLIN